MFSGETNTQTGRPCPLVWPRAGWALGHESKRGAASPRGAPGSQACVLTQLCSSHPVVPLLASERCSWFRSSELGHGAGVAPPVREWQPHLAEATAASPVVDSADGLATRQSAMQASPRRRSFGSGGPRSVVLVGRSSVRGERRWGDDGADVTVVKSPRTAVRRGFPACHGELPLCAGFFQFPSSWFDLSVYLLSVCLPVCLPTYLPTYLPTSLFH